MNGWTRMYFFTSYSLILLFPAHNPCFQKNSFVSCCVWLVERFWDYSLWKWLPCKRLILLSYATFCSACQLDQGSWNTETTGGSSGIGKREAGVCFFSKVLIFALPLHYPPLPQKTLLSCLYHYEKEKQIFLFCDHQWINPSWNLSLRHESKSLQADYSPYY